MERKHLGLVICVVVLAAGTLWIRHYFSPEQVVRRQFFEAVASFENEKIVGVMSKISRTYTDDWGGDFETLGGQIQSLMNGYDDLDVLYEIGGVEVGDDEVRIGLEFTVSGSYEGSWESILGTSIDRCRATLLWKKEQPGWRLAETEEIDIPELREELETLRTR